MIEADDVCLFENGEWVGTLVTPEYAARVAEAMQHHEHEHPADD